MESRKYQLQKQILEAQKNNNNDLYALLKSQWAHRFGVESLEELQNLDFNQVNQKTTNETNQELDQSQDSSFEVDQEISIKDDDNQELDQSQDSSFEVDQEISIKDDNNQEKEIKNQTSKVVTKVEVANKESFEIKSHERVDKENNEKKAINLVSEYNISPKVEALIPLPPKPKYSYLRKWLLRS